MNKISALFIAILLTLSIFLISKYERNNDLERVTVERAIDGDTLDLIDGRRVRLLNINTPEKNERGYQEAKDYLAELNNKTVNLEITGTEKYGRFLGRVYDPRYVNLDIVERGLARSFLVQESETKKFKDAQENARKKQSGIWEHSHYYGCVDAQINKKEEYIVIISTCNSTVGWVVGDESTKRYIIKSNFEEVRLYSGDGKNNETALYWGVGNVWNDDKDSLFIRDKEGFLIYYSQYGY